MCRENNVFFALILLRRHIAPYDIQLLSFCFSHFVVTFFTSDQKSSECSPVISPLPNFEAAIPPNENGSRGTGTPTFTPTMPAFASRITRSAAPPEFVKTEQALPYSE